MTDPQLTSALAAADQQRRNADDGFRGVVAEARRLLTAYGETEAWAVLSSTVRRQLELNEEPASFAADLLAAAALQLVRLDDPGRDHSADRR